MSTRRWVVRAGVLLLLIALPRLIYPILAVDILCWGLFALAFDLVFGYAGLLSFGHAMFWGTSAYVSANLLLRTGLPVPVALLVGMLASLVLAVPTGYLSIRSAGIYFSMVTLAFAQMIDFIARQAEQYTGGDNGLPGIPLRNFGPLHFDNPYHLYYFTFVIAGLGYLVAARAIESPFGQALRAIRDNRTRAQSVGYNPRVQMLVAFMLSAGLSGLAGGLQAIGHGVVSLDAVHWTTSGIVVMMTLLGGTGTLLGPLVGAALVLLLRDALASSLAATGVVTGLVFTATVLFFRRGVIGTLLELDFRRRRRALERHAAPVSHAAAPTQAPAAKSEARAP
ncbi:MAG TPA: branched-chain amino acid ABC transporter permease [Myxococcales bacterium]|nr:branched-chain amino acid ABC transporter permease [Myxococcales bacterium]